MRYGFDFEEMLEAGGSRIITKLTGDDKAKARRGAQCASRKHGSAAMLFFREGEPEACGAVTYVDGCMSSRDGVTLGQAMSVA